MVLQYIIQSFNVCVNFTFVVLWTYNSMEKTYSKLILSVFWFKHFNKYLKISAYQFFLFMVIFILSCMVFYQVSIFLLINISPRLSTALNRLTQNYHYHLPTHLKNELHRLLFFAKAENSLKFLMPPFQRVNIMNVLFQAYWITWTETFPFPFLSSFLSAHLFLSVFIPLSYVCGTESDPSMPGIQQARPIPQ